MPDALAALPDLKHLTIERLGDGIYAAIGVKGGAAFSNAGIVDLGEQTLVFDTLETATGADELRLAAEVLTGRPATIVIISHDHPDHWLGNQVFTKFASFVSTPQICEGMIGMKDELEATPDALAEWDSWIEEQKQSLEKESDPRCREDLQASISRGQHIRRDLPALELVFPNQIFEKKLVFFGTKRTAELLTWGMGHTASDCFLVLPSDKVAFIGDLGFFGRQPFMSFCDPQAWVAQLEKMEQSDIERFVPGHGPVGGKDALAMQRQYMVMLAGFVREAVEAGEPVEAILEKRLPAPFNAWSATGTATDANVHFFYNRLTKASS